MRRITAAFAVLALALTGAAAPAVAAPLETTTPVIAPGSPITFTSEMADVARWSLQVESMCTGLTVRTLAGGAVVGAWSQTFDGLTAAGVALDPGEYRARIRGWRTDGTVVGPAAETPFTVIGTPPAPCVLAARTAPADHITAGLRAIRNSDAGKLVVTTADDAGYAALAANYAQAFGLPLALLPAKVNPTKIVNAAAGRKLAVVIIGSPTIVAASTEKAFRAKKLKTMRVAGADRNATAALIATKRAPQPGSPAVYVSLAGNATNIAIAVAYANARNLPLLPAGNVLPSVVADAISTLQLQGGTAFGDTSSLPDRILKRLPGATRLIGRDVASTSFAVVRAAAPARSTLVVASATDPDALALITRAQYGEHQLLVDGDNWTTTMKSWLEARGDIQRIDIVDERVPAALVTALAAQLRERGPVGALPAVTLQALPSLRVPATFSLSGSGYGHGVGMSQWGAYGMAKEGRTGTEILQHYFTGAVVAPVDDAVEINVSLEQRVASASFRLERLTDPNATLELTDAAGIVRTLLVGDVITTTYNADGTIGVAVKGTSAAGIAPFTTTSLLLRWAGNRDAGTASGTDALLRVAGPGVAIASGKRYRFGTVLITPAKTSGALKLGLQVNNILRLHDEYLYGIAEIGSSWPAAALEAQVIAARAYALKQYQAGVTKDCACHVEDDTDDQNFVGWAKLAEVSGGIDFGAKWKAAVDATLVSETQALALTYGGKVISANYSAASGGATRSNEEVWGSTPVAYLRSVDDPWSVTYAPSNVSRWKPRTFTQAQIAAAFGAPDVMYLDFSDRYPNGAVNNAVAIASNGQRFSLRAATFKSRINAAVGDTTGYTKGLPSSWIWRADEIIPVADPVQTALTIAQTPNLSVVAHPLYKATTVVLVQAPADPAYAPEVTAAAAYAGLMKYGLLLYRADGLPADVAKELTSRKATRVVFAGTPPPAVAAAIAAQKIASSTIVGATAVGLSAALATARGLKSGNGLVVAAVQDAKSQPLAVNLAVRTGRTLLLVDANALTPEVAAVLNAVAPAPVFVVGAPSVLPDALFAGVGTAQRLLTADALLAATIALTHAFDATRTGVALIATTTPVAIGSQLAASGFPLLQSDTAVPAELATILRSSPLAAIMLRSADAVRDVARALQRA